MEKIYRLATIEDLDAIDAVYQETHDAEEAGLTTIGWKRAIYPTRETAQAALERNDMYVCEIDGKVIATAIINQIQVDVYADVTWSKEATDEEVLVLHTLAVDPAARYDGVGKGFVKFYEEMGREMGCTDLRMDTNAINKIARNFYKELGFTEVGIVPTVFNGIPGINLVMLEKVL